jgi:hypothetical protein
MRWCGALSNMAVPVAAVAEAAATAKGTLLLRAWSRTRCPVPRLLSGPARSPEFEVIADGVEVGERVRPLDEDLHVIEPLVQAL